MALNPIAATLSNRSRRNIKVQLSIPAGATLDDVASQLLNAGLSATPEPVAPTAPVASAVEDAPKAKRR